MGKLNVVILAGDDENIKNGFIGSKALIKIKEKPMIVYILEALQKSRYINRIVIVGNVEKLQQFIDEKKVEIIQQKNSMIKNLKEAASKFNKSEKIIVTTCDIPLVNERIIDDFIMQALEIETDLFYPIVERVQCQNNFPDIKRTYIKLRDGEFTGGNIVLINTAIIDKVERIADLIIKNRKKPIKIARILGFCFAIRFLLNQLSIQNIEDYIYKKFDIKGKASITPFAQIGTDVDNVRDILLIEKYIDCSASRKG